MGLSEKQKEWITVILGTIVFSLLNISHVIYWAFRKPPNTIFIGITHLYEDYFYYLSQLTQGATGNWHLINKFTLEDIPMGYNWLFNLLLGKLSPILSVPVWHIYSGAIFVLSFIYILLVYKILWIVYPYQKLHRIGALLITLTSTQLLSIVKGPTGIILTPITYFYAYTAAWDRFGGVAHQIAQNILTLAAIMLFSKLLALAGGPNWNKRRYFILSILLVCTLTALMTISIFYVLLDLIIFFAASVYFGYVYKTRTFITRIGQILLLIAIPISILFSIQWQLLAYPFWQFVQLWEKVQPPAPFFTFLLSYGPIFLLLPFGFFRFLKIKTPLRVLGMLYAFFPVFFYYSPFPKLLQIPPFRFLQPPAYVFFGMVAIEAILRMGELFQRKKTIAVYTILTLFLVLQIPGLIVGQEINIGHYYFNSHLNFVDRDIYDGLRFLKGKQQDKHVLAVDTLELFVPVISGHSVYVGHATLTTDYHAKIEKTVNFFAKKLSLSDAQNLIESNNIGYVLQSTWSADISDLSLVYPFLNIVYKNPKLTIYTVE